MQEMTMVERVARAIADADMEDYEGAENLYNAKARAAIEAMREPTLEMLQDGRHAARSVRVSGIGGQTVENSIRMETAREAAAWAAMIDAALSE